MMRARDKGFTIIELMLAMAFLSILMLAIAMGVIQITHTYNKGLTIRGVNQIGRSLSDSIKRDARTMATGGGVYVAPESAGGLGRLCLGSKTYVWNTADKLRDNDGVRYDGDQAADMIVMARVDDVGGSYCISSAGSYPMNVPKNIATEMVQSKYTPLAIHSVRFDNVLAVDGAPEPLYRFRFTIGTNQTGTIDADDTCKPPADADHNYNFCAVNSFELLLRVG